jgi:hypothetical protein
MTLTKKKFKRIMQEVKKLERSGLEILPPEVALHEQTGYLLGFAQCWNMVYSMVRPHLPDTPQ